MFSWFKSKIAPKAESKSTELDKVPNDKACLKESLKNYAPFCEISEKFLILAFEFTEIVTFPKKEIFIALDDEDAFDYFLLEGQVSLMAKDKRIKLIAPEDKQAKTALSYLRPRRFSCRAESDSVVCLKIARHVVEAINNIIKNYKNNEREVVEGYEGESHLFERIDSELKRENLNLPSLPDVALKIRQACQDPDIDLAHIADIAYSDASITTKLLKASNSAFFRGQFQITNLHQAVCRLGKDATNNLVTYYAINELFTSDSSLLNKRFETVFKQSIETAVFAKIIAKKHATNLDPESAFLCGLLLNIGQLPIYAYAIEYLTTEQELATVTALAEKHRAKVGLAICEHWNLPPMYSFAIRHVEDWDYLADNKIVDYVEVVIVAEVHQAIQYERVCQIPPVKDIPSMAHVLGASLSPEQSVSIILAARKELELYII
jgi:HD-like signal output (HDOD) protein